MRLILTLLLFCLPGLAVAQQDAPRVTAELAAEESVVGQPVILRITVLVPTFLPQPPVFPELEQPGLLIRLPERAGGPVSETIDGQTWAGVSRAYRIYPLAAGVFEIAPEPLGVTYADPDGGEPLSVSAPLPALQLTGTLPEAARDLDPPVLASNFTLEQSVEGGPDLAAGDAITRTLTATIDGTTAILIPPLIPAETPPALRGYPKEPVVQESENRGVLSGTRVEAVTYLAQAGGTVELPPVSLDWYNTETGTIETASVEGISLTVADPPASAAPRDLRHLIGPILAAVVVMLLAIFWDRRIATPIRALLDRWVARWRRSERYAHREVLRAFRARSLDRVYTALDRWARHHPNRSGPAEDKLAAALAEIGASHYGNDGQATPHQWSAARSAYISMRRDHGSAQTGASGLPPLNP